jgi:hypothetical protein
MTTLNPNHLRDITSFDDVIEYLTDELDWPIDADDLEEATFEWDPDELGIPADRVPHLASLRQLRPLETDQPWGIFFLEFDGPRLPLTALRRLLDKLVTKKRATGSGTRRTWDLNDLLFIITTSTGDTVELHFIAFFEQPDKPAEIRSIPWRPGQSPAQHLKRLATELLPHLAWPDDPAAVDDWRSEWRAAFKLRHGEAIATTTKLVDRMASTATQVREGIAAALLAEAGSGPFSTLLAEVREELVGSVTAGQFADMCAQTLVYGALTSRVTDPVAFGASPTLSSIPLANPFLTAFFEEVHDHAVQLDSEDHLEQLVADLKVSNVEAILDKFGATEKGGDPVIHFYEDFLAAYDPDMKIQVGAFYTPQAAVKHMVGMVDAVLKERLGLPLGVADPTTWGELTERLGLDLPGVIDPASQFVSMLDPATGTGTFLVEWIRRARVSFVAVDGEAGWPEHARDVVLPGLHALELMLAPYAIAHLKTALELHDADVDGADLAIYLTDTLQRGGSGQLSIEADPISVEGERADHVKRSVRSTIAIGNPPYDRVAQDDGSGGWITDRSGGRSPFDDILDPAREHTIFSHHASLYNKFVYFWRWAIWKVFEDRPGLPGVVSLITPSSWLSGPGFLGLRQLVREVADEIWVTDLGGDNRGARRDPNIFDIETPVAIVTIARLGSGDASASAQGWYRRVSGSREEKLKALGSKLATLDDPVWAELPSGWHDPLEPLAGAEGWQEYPALIDLFPWQQPGCKFGRTWPIAPAPELLAQRWARLVSTDDPDDRARCFVTARTGRTISTNVGQLRRLADEPVGATSAPIVRYQYRSFDRQWTFDDPRLAALERPSLWAAVSDQQIFMVSKPTHAMGAGPAATAATAVPDLDCFRGSFGGKDVIPLHRDANGTPNADPALLATVQDRIDYEGGLGVADLFTYTYALLAGSDYTARFAAELETPGPRVPLTADADLFGSTVALGEELLWLHTYGDRFGEGRGGLLLPSISADGHLTLPETPRDIRYNAETLALRIGDGKVNGVLPEVWSFEVSGMQVVKKWLGYRTARGAGRSASSDSPLDQIRPTSWLDEWTVELLELLSVLQRTVDLQSRGVELLDRILAGRLISASDLPEPPPELRQPPGSSRGPTQAALEL